MLSPRPVSSMPGSVEGAPVEVVTAAVAIATAAALRLPHSVMLNPLLG